MVTEIIFRFRPSLLGSFDQRAEAARYHTLLRETLATEHRGDRV